ncbi:MAG: DUF2891 domain-containing protein [Thermomicrobiales bacterium]
MTFEREERLSLLKSHAASFVDVAIRTATTEYPHFPYFIATGPESYRTHRDYHPAFYGSFDWHSCVEMHFVAIRLLRMFPEETAMSKARETLNSLLTTEHLHRELAFFRTPANRSLERPYGWGWLMLLAAELEQWDDPDAANWLEAVSPLAIHFMEALLHWLPRLTYPQRTGVHPNTAFSLVNALSLARRHPDTSSEEAIISHAMRLFKDDADYPFRYEPSGADFLSPGLCEAVLMMECLQPEEFDRWFARFTPGGMESLTGSVVPVHVSDPSDGQIAHLHGLNLSRAWALVRLAERTTPHAPERVRLLELARSHVDVSLSAVYGSDYMVEHWLAVYALILLSA